MKSLRVLELAELHLAGFVRNILCHFFILCVFDVFSVFSIRRARRALCEIGFGFFRTLWLVWFFIFRLVFGHVLTQIYHNSRFVQTRAMILQNGRVKLYLHLLQL